jgi:formylglycine-generating enzyme required for sulfatase activity
MVKKTLVSVLAAGLILAWLLSGCAGPGQNILPSPDPGQTTGLPPADPCQPPAQQKAGDFFVKLKTGWNLFTCAIPSAKKFTTVTMTWNGETKLLKDAAPGWTQSTIRALRGRAIQQLATTSLTATFQPNSKYYIYSTLNGATLNFNRPFITGINPASGLPGASVTLTGCNFGTSQGNSIITFNGITAAASSWNDTQIVCAVPEGAATGPVTVSVSGRASNNDRIFTFVPIITAISPSFGNTGAVITISGSHFGTIQGTNTVTFNGIPVGPIDPPTNWSDTSIVCAASGYGAVVVTVNGLASNDDKLFDLMEFVTIPAGEFIMGSPEGVGNAYERPQHIVYLDAYQIGKYEVTNAQYKAFEAASGYRSTGDWQNAGGRLSGYGTLPAYENHPALYISWNDAMAFCAFYGYRLPTEAEWEKAARGTDGRMYTWGDEWDPNKCNWYSGPAYPGMAMIYNSRGTLPVGSFPSYPSLYGVNDMAGSARVWCSDWYSDTYYASSPSSNPKGPDSGTFRVLRGGGWNYSITANLRIAYRGKNGPTYQDLNVGFRVAKNIP